MTGAPWKVSFFTLQRVTSVVSPLLLVEVMIPSVRSAKSEKTKELSLGLKGDKSVIQRRCKHVV